MTKCKFLIYDVKYEKTLLEFEKMWYNIGVAIRRDVHF